MGAPYNLFFQLVSSGLYLHPSGYKIKKSFGYIKNLLFQLSSLIHNFPITIKGQTIYLADYEPIDVYEWGNYIRRTQKRKSLKKAPLFILKLASRFGNFLQYVCKIRAPLSSFRLNNLLTEMIYNTTPIQRFVPQLPKTWQEGVSETVDFFAKMSKCDSRFLGVPFSVLSTKDAVLLSKSGGLFLAPSGPGLAQIDRDHFYMTSLRNADLNLADSGLAIFLMRCYGLGKLKRNSGLGFLKSLLRERIFAFPGTSYWVMPTQKSCNANASWLHSQNIKVPHDFYYIAPIYPREGSVTDHQLLDILEQKQPLFIFICVGSGPQEKLGFWLKQHLSYKPSIICIGAAIGFLSGDQVKIPSWVDKICMGWLLRCLSDPWRFIPRYLQAFRLVYLATRYRDQAPSKIYQ
jgi:UDP-N-acetyl-D-mannosaminuronic acid transferase (WecB/TagA/CpsF family)